MSKEITSKLGFGTMRLPVKEDGKINWELGEKMVDYAYENGVNYFDTAWPYHGGESELFIGHALKKYDRESFFLASKMPVGRISKKEEVDQIFTKQLEKCQVEYFDYYLVHAVNRDNWQTTLKLEVIEYLKEKKAEGKIKKLGFSFHDSADQLEAMIQHTDWDFIQLQLNYYDMANNDAKILLSLANKYNLPIIVMEPVRGGFLANVVPEAVKEITDAYGENKAASLAVSYAMSLPGVQVVLSGMSDMEQTVDNVATAKEPIPMDEKAEKVLDRVMEDINNFKSVPCTKCRYCMPCPVGLDIPEIFRIYNDWNLFKNPFRLKGDMANLEKKPSDCVSCGKCTHACPQRIDVPTLMKEISRVYEEELAKG